MCAFHSLHTEFFYFHISSEYLFFKLLHGVQKSCAVERLNKLFFTVFPWKIRYFPLFYLFSTIFPLFHIVATVGSQRRALFTCFLADFMLKYQGGTGATLKLRTYGSNRSHFYTQWTIISLKSTFYWCRAPALHTFIGRMLMILIRIVQTSQKTVKYQLLSARGPLGPPAVSAWNLRLFRAI